MSRPSVLMLTTTLPANEGDGTPAFVLDLAQHMDADVTIIAPRSRGCDADQKMGAVAIRRFRYGPAFFESVADEAILPAIQRRPVLALQLPGLVIGMAITMARAKRELGPEVIHAHWILPAGLIAALLRGSETLLITAHGADAFSLRGRLPTALKRWVLRRADAVHAVSEDIAGRLDQIETGCVSAVHPIGVDVGDVAARTTPRKPNGRLLFVGRLAEKKGVDVLLRALAYARDELEVEAELDIVGDGPSRDALEALTAKLALDDAVTFHGALERAAVLEAYRTSAVAVLPSKTATDGDRDGTPVVLMEAIAAQVPVVASDVGGIGELLEDGRTAWLVPEADVGALARAITDALSDSARRRQRAITCKDSLVEQIDVERIARSLLEAAA